MSEFSIGILFGFALILSGFFTFNVVVKRRISSKIASNPPSELVEFIQPVEDLQKLKILKRYVEGLNIQTNMKSIVQKIEIEIEDEERRIIRELGKEEFLKRYPNL